MNDHSFSPDQLASRPPVNRATGSNGLLSELQPGAADHEQQHESPSMLAAASSSDPLIESALGRSWATLDGTHATGAIAGAAVAMHDSHSALAKPIVRPEAPAEQGTIKASPVMQAGDSASALSPSHALSANLDELPTPPISHKSASTSPQRSEDPEDWWEDEDSDEAEDDGVTSASGAALPNGMPMPSGNLSAMPEAGREERLCTEKASSYKADMHEYRSSKKALTRSNNLRLFASTTGNGELPEQHRPPFQHVQDEADTITLDGPASGLGLLPNGDGCEATFSRRLHRTADPQSPLLSSPEVESSSEAELRPVPDLMQPPATVPAAPTSLPNGSSSNGAVPPSAPESGMHKRSSSSLAANRPIIHHRRSSSVIRGDVRPMKQPATVKEQQQEEEEKNIVGPFSLWDYLQEEVLATDFDSTQELKWERVTNFMAIPFWMEKIIAFGFVVCLDSFLYTFTIMPLRFLVASWQAGANALRWLLRGEKRYLSSSHKCDLLKAILFIMACYILSRVTDASKMYHSVRGQDLVKLYVIFNVLEIADRLCCSFGQDILDTLFSRTTLARRRDGRQPYLRPFAFFTLSLAYVIGHTLVLFYQMVTLNVAINSYDNALLSLLLSNQFVEIKGSVFKKFEKENLFQMTCADIVERFQLALMLSFIAVRNLIELAGAQSEGGTGPLPTSFTVLPSFNLLETIFTPVCIVIASECFVDWLKHAFITKFNHIRPAVYGRFMDVLCRDLVIASPGQKSNAYKHTFVDQSPIVSRRLGFAALPLACLLVRVGFQIMGMVGDTSHFDECAIPEAHRHRISFKLARSTAFGLGAMNEGGAVHRSLQFIAQGLAWILTIFVAWTFLVGIKILLGMNLVSYASKRYATMYEREQEEKLNARDRSPIGVGAEERVYDAKLAEFLDKSADNAQKSTFLGAEVPNGQPRWAESKGGSKQTSLLDVSRYTMVRSRLW